MAGAPQKLDILWRIVLDAPQKVDILWRMGPHAPQKVTFLWRMWFHAPQNCAAFFHPTHPLWIAFSVLHGVKKNDKKFKK